MSSIIACVRDAVVESFGQPMFFANRAAAVRAFRTEVVRADPANPLYNNRVDYDLFEIGSYNEATGTIDPCAPAILCHGRDIASDV